MMNMNRNELENELVMLSGFQCAVPVQSHIDKLENDYLSIQTTETVYA